MLNKQNQLPGFFAVILLALFVLSSARAFAGSATWNVVPGSGDWNTAGNWMPATVPNGPADTATFNFSVTSGVSLSANTEVNGITFNPFAAIYTITASPGLTLTLSGVGITNSSGITQHFVSAANGAFTFFNSATAGTSTTFTNNGGTVSGEPGGKTVFHDTSTAGSATITNIGTTFGATGGLTEFLDTSTAGSATITNNGNGEFIRAGGSTVFHDTSTAGSATITNNGGIVVGADGGFTEFFDTSTGGSATITNNGATVSGAFGGFTKFHDTSSASSATITNNGGTVSGAGSGSTKFFDASTASSATINNNGPTVSGASIGVTDFNQSSTAGSATINNNGSTVSGSSGGFTDFFNASTAGSATINNNGGTVSGGGGGFTDFHDTSAAGSATLIANGGTNGGGGGQILFLNDSTGGTARVEVFGNGSLDISKHNLPGVTIGSLQGTGNVFLGAENLTVGGNNLSTTFSGVIQDGGFGGGTGGSLTKIGTGTLALSGVNTYTGNTTVNGGEQDVDGSIASPNTFANPGGTLGGMGAIGGNVANSGIVSPGDNSPGTLTVNGNYTQNANGTLKIEIGGLAPAQHDLLQLPTGSAALTGTLQLVRLNNFMPVSGDRVTIITDGSGHSGIFSTVTSTFTGLIQPVPMYNETTDVYVLFEQSATFQSQGLTPNQRAVGEDIDDSANDPRAAALVGFLGSEPLANLPADLDLIAPDELASIYEVGFSQAVVQNNNLQHRMDDIRAGSTGFSSAGYQAPAVSSKDGKDVIADKNMPPVFVAAPDNRWGVFVTGSGDFVNVDDHDFNAPGYDITTGNVLLGVDYRIGQHVALGIDGSYASSTVDLVNRGRIDVDGGKAGVYGTVYGFKILGADVHLDGALGGGWNNYDTNRTGLQGLPVRGSSDGTELNALIAYGGDYHFGHLLVGSWSTVQYTNIDLNGFTETGSLAPLRYPDQSQDSFRSSTGLRIAYEAHCGHLIIRPEVRAGYQHESEERAYPITANFANGTGNTFTVFGPSIGRDSALVDAGVSVSCGDRYSAFVYYDGVLGRSNYDNHSVSGGIRVSF
ncbi:MAG: autotransporter domain-containing protein [Verrucomicrobiota bacterium]|nr:autotransporter domain-containing protein [Verrucomicrobiota bacterium]